MARGGTTMRTGNDGSDYPGEVLPFPCLGQDFTPGISRRSQDQLGMSLRAMYQELAEQPLPERFVELLAALDAEKQEPS